MFLNYQFNIPSNIKSQMVKQLNEGEHLFKILTLLNFKPMIVSRIKFGELYGEFNDILHEVINYCQLQQKQFRQMMQVLTYPTILMCVLFIMIVFFNQLIIPQFTAFYLQDQIAMTSMITIVMYILALIPKLMISGLSIIVIIVGYLWLLSRKQNIYYFCSIMYHLPVIKFIFKHYMTFVFTRELSYFLRNGFSLNQTLVIFNQLNHKYIRYMTHYLLADIESGYSLSEVIKKHTLFVDDCAIFIEHGEMNGILSEELKLFSELCLERIINKTNRYLKIMQPALFALLALMIIGLYCVIMMPMFDLLHHFGEGG